MRDSTALLLLFFGISATFLFLTGLYFVLTPTNEAIPAELESELAQTSVWIKYEWYGIDRSGNPVEGGTTGSGVIIGANDEILDVYTSRHVIDCLFTNQCAAKTKEHLTIRTQDGITHEVRRIEVAPGNLDIAIIQAEHSGTNTYPVADSVDSRNYNGQVYSVGYPLYAEGVVEFRIDNGNILERRELITQKGISFTSIESDAYTYSGSSGGGLFNNQGQLLGISTWAGNGISTAITSESLPPRGSYTHCAPGTYPHDNGTCAPYCTPDELLNEKLECIRPCDDFYCGNHAPSVKDIDCGEGYVRTENGECKEACGGRYYCDDSTAICYQGTCTTCPAGLQLYTDGKCYE